MMMETDKILHLKRYIMLFRNVSSKSYMTGYLQQSYPKLKCRGYSLQYMHQHAFKTHPRNYAANIRTFSTITQTSIENIEDKVMSFCDSVKNGQLSAENLKNIISLCDSNSYQLPHNTSILLLRCCGNLLSNLNIEERQKFTSQVWRLIESKNESLNVEHYNTLLNVYAENSNSINPKEFLSSMTINPDENTYRLLLNMCAKVGNNRYLRDILSTIKEKNISIDEDTLNALVQTYAMIGNIAETELLIAFMTKANFSVAKAYTELACGYAKLGDIPNLMKILDQEPQSNANLLKIVKSLSISGNGKHIPVILNFLTASLQENESEIKKTIIELIRKKQTEDAYTIVHWFALNNSTTVASSDLTNSFLNELVMINLSVNDIIKYASNFVESGYNPQALTNIVEIGLKLGRESLCLAAFHAMKEKDIAVRPHYYWPLLLMAHRDKGESRIYFLVNNMVNTGVELDSDTLINYVFPYVNTANPIITWQRLLSDKLPTDMAHTSLVSFLLSNNRLQDAVSLCNYVSFKFDYRFIMKPLVNAYINTRDIESCITLFTVPPFGQKYVSLFLSSLLNDQRFNADISDIQLLVESFKEHGLGISEQDADFMKQKYAKIKGITANMTEIFKLIHSLVDKQIEHTALSMITSIDYMNTDELACHLVELKSQKFTARKVLQRLLQVYCDENKLEKAEEIKQEIDANKFICTYKMKMCLFELYLKHDKLKEAEVLLADIQSTNTVAKMDNTKVLMYATMLIKAGKLSTALELLENDDVRFKINAKRLCAILLDTVAHSQYHNYTKTILNLLVTKGYCTITSELLKPLVSIPLEQNDIRSAMDEYIKCIEIYGKAPLTLELLVALLEQSNNQISDDVNICIKRIYNIVTNFESIQTANTLLVIALATLNKMEELRDILQKRQISMTQLMHYFNYTYKYNAKTLLRIFEASSDISIIDESVLCDMLLTIYSRTGDYHNALALWGKIQARNIKVSEEFKQYFIQFLSFNKLPLPPEFMNKSEVTVNN